jgi:hypothetical protein
MVSQLRFVHYYSSSDILRIVSFWAQVKNQNRNTDHTFITIQIPLIGAKPLKLAFLHSQNKLTCTLIFVIALVAIVSS